MNKEQVWEILQYDIRISEYRTKYWYQNGKLHRVNGPAAECADGSKHWFLNGRRHRADGPAIEFSNGDKYWYLNGWEYSEQEFNELQKQP